MKKIIIDLKISVNTDVGIRIKFIDESKESTLLDSFIKRVKKP